MSLDFRFEQINIIASAITDYHIVGVKAFRAAIREATLHDVEHRGGYKGIQQDADDDALKEITAKFGRCRSSRVRLISFFSVGDWLYQHCAKALDAAVPIVHQVFETIQYLK